MNLGILQGYNAVTQQYTNGGGQIENLPKPGIIVSLNPLTSDYDNFGTTPENWATYAVGLVGDITGFKDWGCLRAEIKQLIVAIAGNDFSDWNLLNAAQKLIALEYIPTKIIDEKGTDFYFAQCGSQELGNYYLDNYQKLSEAGRKKRLMTFGNFGYAGLGKDQGLILERMYQALALDRSYTIRGVMFESEDGLPGIGDWVFGTADFTVNGLKPLLNAGTYNLLPGFPYSITEFCDILATSILENGIY